MQPPTATRGTCETLLSKLLKTRDRRSVLETFWACHFLRSFGEALNAWQAQCFQAFHINSAVQDVFKICCFGWMTFGSPLGSLYAKDIIVHYTVIINTTINTNVVISIATRIICIISIGGIVIIIIIFSTISLALPLLISLWLCLWLG